MQNTKLNTLKLKLNKVDKEISDTTALIFLSQYNTDRQNFEKKLEMLIKLYQLLVD